ncbi:BMP family ABC transporter substrate-binding protein, partial [Streptococcus danieliae]|nr:BMP family ABC transporter substrate-binding protein [Streptococcus danieliae]
MNKKPILAVAGLAVASLGLVACGQRENTENSEAKVKASLVTSVGGVDDKSFNQSAWEGLEAWGKAQGL